MIEDDLALRWLKSQLAQVFNQYLREDEAKCLTIRFGLADGQPKTVKATGEEMGLSFTEVKKVMFSAMSKLRKPHVAAALKDYMQADFL